MVVQVRLSSDPVPREELVGVACTPAMDGTVGAGETNCGGAGGRAGRSITLIDTFLLHARYIILQLAAGEAGVGSLAAPQLGIRHVAMEANLAPGTGLPPCSPPSP